MPRRLAAARRPVAAALLALAAAAPAAAQDVDARAVAVARDAVYPALVNLTVVTETFNGGRALHVLASGSGVVVTPQGHVLTNYHVAGHATRITATLTDGEVLAADVVVHDPLTDLSVLRLRVPPGHVVAAAELGESDGLEVGDPVLAMGNPLALASSVSLGIVSNPKRVFTDVTGTDLAEPELAEGERTGIFTRWIQHDALILPGNSGGPLVDLAGRVVGINELGGAGIGFAIPADVARRVLEQAIAHGEIRRGWLGFTVLPVAKLGRRTGALVASVLDGSPAARAGLVPGDVLLRLGGEPVTVRFVEQVPPLYARIADLPPGSEVPLEVERDGAERTLRAEVEPMQRAVGEEAEVGALGVTVQEVTRPMALAAGLPSDHGLRVTGVRPGSPLESARPAVTAGDLLLSWAGRPLEVPADLVAAAGTAAEAAAVSYRREGEDLFTVVEPAARPGPRFGGELPAAWLGLRTQVVGPEIATALGLPEPGGFRVTEVFPWTEAARAGLAVGDVIRAFDGTPLLATRPQEREDLRRAVERSSPGETVTLEVLRPQGGAGVGVPAASFAPLEVPVTLEAAPEEPSAADRTRQEDLELAVRDVTFSDRIDRGWDRDQQGVVVVEVEQGGWAHLAGLRLGDLVLRVAGEPVPDVEAFTAVTGRVLAARPEVIPVFLRRDHRTHFVFIEPDWPEAPPAGGAAATTTEPSP